MRERPEFKARLIQEAMNYFSMLCMCVCVCGPHAAVWCAGVAEHEMPLNWLCLPSEERLVQIIS